jgi:hypothetical protein
MLFREEVFGKKYRVADLLGNYVAHACRDYSTITLYVEGKQYNDIPLEERNLGLFIQNCLIDKKDFFYGPDKYDNPEIEGRGYHITVRESEILIETNGCIKGRDNGEYNFSVVITNDQLPYVIELVKRVLNDQEFGVHECK